MKNYFLFLVGSLLLIFQSCSSQNINTDPKLVNDLVNSQEFTFHAQRANPTNYDVINIINSMPNSTATRMLELSSGMYSIELKNKTMEVVLPYFGRAFNPSYGGSNDKNSYRFTSKDFEVVKSQNKKGNWLVKITPKDINYVSQINIEIYKNGRAFTSINSNDRQPISYDGYIDKNEIPKP